MAAIAKMILMMILAKDHRFRCSTTDRKISFKFLSRFRMVQMIADGVDFSSPVSPRSTYISSCIREGLNPRAALILRKKVTKRLKLQHMGIGDKMGKIFSESIAGMLLMHE